MSANNWMARPNAKKSGIILAAGVLTAQPLMAGPVLLNQAPPVATAPLEVQDEAANNPMNVFTTAGMVNPFGGGLIQYGPVILHPHVNYIFLDGTGIEYSPGNQESVIEQTLSPGLTANLGRHWTVDYTPSLNFYSGGTLQDSVDHSFSLNGATSYEDWTLGFSQNFNSSSDPNTETAAQTSQQSYGTTLSAAYAFNDKWVENSSLNQNISLVSGFQDSYTWTAQQGVSYVFSPRLNAGVNFSGGYTSLSGNGSASTNNNPDSVNETLQVNGAWRVTDKISLQGSIGVSDQQFLAAGYGDSLNPIFSTGIQYQPFLVTQISLNASRATTTSDYFIQAQTSDITSVNLGLTQRVLVKYHLNLSAGFSRTEYTSTLSILNISLGNVRIDNDYSFTASFGRDFLKHGNWLITYAYNNNQSTLEGFSQQSNQIGFQIGFNY